MTELLKTALILDLETTGIEPAVDKIIEVGMILYSLEHHAIAKSVAFLVDAGAGNPAAHVNGIPPALVVDAGVPYADAFRRIDAWMQLADVVMGHSAYEFDRRFLLPELQKRREWIDTCHDVEWPHPSGARDASAVDGEMRKRPGKSLVALALENGLGVSHAHRALTDCDLIARILTRVHERGVDVQALLRRAMRPKARFAVADRGFDAKRNELVKSHGFRWEPEGKNWVRRMACDDAAALPFRVIRIGEAA